MQLPAEEPKQSLAVMMVYAGFKTVSDALLLVGKHFPDEHNSDNGSRLCTTLPSHKDKNP